MKKTLLATAVLSLLTACSSEESENKQKITHNYSKDQAVLEIPSKNHVYVRTSQLNGNKKVDGLVEREYVNGNPIETIIFYSPEKEVAFRRHKTVYFNNEALPIPKDLVLELSELKAKTNYIQERLDNIVYHFDSLSESQKNTVLSSSPESIELYLEKNVAKTKKPALSTIYSDSKKESVGLHSVVLIDYTKDNTALFQGPYGLTALKTNGEELFRNSKYFVKFIPFDKPITVKGAEFEIEGIIDSIKMNTKEGL